MLFFFSFFMLKISKMTNNVHKFTDQSHMILSATTLKNLEILKNSMNYTEKGSLLWLLKSTKSSFGTRMLKEWICHPLTEKKYISFNALFIS